MNERAQSPERIAVNRRDFLGGAMAAALAVSAELPGAAFTAEAGAEPLDAEQARRLIALLSDDGLFSRGQRHVYQGKHLGAISLPGSFFGEKRTVHFVLAWHFPNVQAVPGHHGNMYATNLPYWLLDRINSQVAILSSMTCTWAKDGFFYAWEGCNPAAGCCEGNATHVWGYAQAHARLFPEIGRVMRDADAGNVTPEGMLTVRFSHHFPVFDGQCSFVMSSYREYLLSPNRKWFDSRWPIIKRTMDYAIARWDAADTSSEVEQEQGGVSDGMLSGPQHAMDGDQGGTCSWLGSMYLGALAAAARMATLQGDAASAARYRQILSAGSKNQDKALFNHNFYSDLKGFQQSPRKFCDETDAGMHQGTWPKGGKPKPPHVIQNTSEIMSGFEYSAAGMMLYAGLAREAFAVLRAAADRYDGWLRTGLSGGNCTAWGYSGNPFGDDECGKFYARAMAIWTILLACQGFSYDGPAGKIGFARPALRPVHPFGIIYQSKPEPATPPEWLGWRSPHRHHPRSTPGRKRTCWWNR